MIKKWIFSFCSKKYFQYTLAWTIYRITRFFPNNIRRYMLALQHKSAYEHPQTNERLEFLGDAVLTLVTTHYLFQKYPQATEGFLTQLRSNMNNRKILNNIGYQLQLHRLIKHQLPVIDKNHHILGNTLEALIGALYLDRGYRKCSRFIIQKIFANYIETTVVEQDQNYKGKIYAWAHKKKKVCRFLTNPCTKEKKIFKTILFWDEQIIAEGIGKQKKVAEQAAAQKACVIFNI